MTRFSRAQAVSLVLLRTLIGWHFLYEGYYKLALPAWSASGQPLGHWSAAGYLRAATGPLAGAFHSVAASRLVPWVDVIVPVALALVGLSLTLGLFTRLGCWGAMALLTLFYVAAIPTSGAPVTGQEGTYLLVSKNLIELVAMMVVLTCHTERIAGLDLLFAGRSARLDPPTQTSEPNVVAGL
jgi:thiosulfate dehydrogenase [quinone] large subunit